MRAWAGLVIAIAGCATSSPAVRVREAVAAGELRYRVSTEAEIVAAIGPVLSASVARDGGSETIRLDFPDEVMVRMTRPLEGIATLWRIDVAGSEVDIGAGRPIVIAAASEIARLDPWVGLQGVSLAGANLRGAVIGLPFDTQTVWPPKERMPAFDPAAAIERDKDPGPGIRALHARKVDGRGVTIAIIDQPLATAHVELPIVHYEAIDVGATPPQPHASRVASIAAGKTVGVAPGARLYFYAVPMWRWRGPEYASLLDRIVAEKVARVVSISTSIDGPEWAAAKKRAEDSGVAVLTCDATEALSYGIAGTRFQHPDPRVQLPLAPRTLASERGADVYVHDPTGGMSWGPPWIAGLFALALQSQPTLTPAQLVERLIATQKDGAPDPARFVMP